MTTLKNRPLNCKLTRDDFETRRECEDEIINIRQIKKDIQKERAEFAALDCMTSAMRGFRHRSSHAHMVDTFYIITPSGEKIKV